MQYRLFTDSPPREAVAPLYYEKRGKWNQVCNISSSFIHLCCFLANFSPVCFKGRVLVLQVDPSVRMDIVESGGVKTRGVLYQLHPVTLLNT